MTSDPVGDAAVRTLGIEEELMLVDLDSGRLVPAGDAVVARGGADLEVEPSSWSRPVVKPEFFLEQVECASRPCSSLDELDAEVRAGRALVADAARHAGVAPVAMPTPVVSQPAGRVTPSARYEEVHDTYGRVAHESSICAMHVHVRVHDEEEGVAVLDRVRPWIPVLVALAANSPFWRGADTGHDSWRWHVWRRWPSTGPAEPFGDPATYHAVTRQILETGAAQDVPLLNFETRLSTRYPTVEFRVFDVCTEVDDAVAIAGVVRALVETSAAAWRDGAAVPSWRSDVLRSASWRAARWGLSRGLLDPVTGELVSAAEAVSRLVSHVSGSLAASGDRRRVSRGLGRILEVGNGAARQRRVHAEVHDLAAVVRDLARRTYAEPAAR